MIFLSKNWAKFFNHPYLKSGNYRLVYFLFELALYATYIYSMSRLYGSIFSGPIFPPNSVYKYFLYGMWGITVRHSVQESDWRVVHIVLKQEGWSVHTVSNLYMDVLWNPNYWR